MYRVVIVGSGIFGRSLVGVDIGFLDGVVFSGLVYVLLFFKFIYGLCCFRMLLEGFGCFG